MRVRTGAGILAGTMLLLSACGSPPSDDSGGGGSFKACMVTDTGGVDDRSFNASVWKGLQDAKVADSEIEPSYVASTTEADYEPNLNAAVDQGCGIVVAVGGLMADATEKIRSEERR